MAQPGTGVVMPKCPISDVRYKMNRMQDNPNIFIETVMSDQQQFQSADKECTFETINFEVYSNSMTPGQKSVKENQYHWKFQKNRRTVPYSFVANKPETRNISFETEEPNELSSSDRDSEQERRSVFSSHYKQSQWAYKKNLTVGTRWLGNREYFASVFVDLATLSRTDIFELLKPTVARPIPDNSLCFDSSLESGNLLAVYRVNENEYDVMLENDINSKGNTQWFYFEIKNVRARAKIKINIVNMVKSDSLFNYGMLPCIYSAAQQRLTGNGWTRAGFAISYFRNNMRVDGSRRYHYTLTFTIMSQYDRDDLRIAQCYPYTVSDLTSHLEKMEKKGSKKGVLIRETVGETIGRHGIVALKVSEQNPRKKQQRPLIFVTARQHPGETPGSFVCEGFTEFILSDEKEATFLRKNYEIVILPMLNPDGTKAGNYRTNLCGLDLNRRWDGSKPREAQESLLVKKYICELSRNREIAFLIDLHGHSRKLFSFFYGNCAVQNPYDVRIYPYICSKVSDSRVRFEDCTFACQEAKRRTARIQLGNKFRIPNVFTFEVSFFGFLNQKKEKVHFTMDGFRDLGRVLAKSMFVHERAKLKWESVEGFLVRKYYEELRNKPSLMLVGDKTCSGSESEPEKAEMQEAQRIKLQSNVEFSKELPSNEDNKSLKKINKKQILIREVSKVSRQLHVMDIARVHSMFPNDVLALMPTSYTKKTKERDKVCSQIIRSRAIQTDDVPFVKIYGACKHQQKQREQRMAKNASEITPSPKNKGMQELFRPNSSRNSCLESCLKYPSLGKQEARKRHESGVSIAKALPKKINTPTQTLMTFVPNADCFGESFSCLMVNSISSGLNTIKRRKNYSTMDKFASSGCKGQRPSNHSFKIGLKALNVETWKKKTIK